MDKISFEEVCKMGDGWWWLWLYQNELRSDSNSEHLALTTKLL